jgi:hypothetical protein
LQKQFNEREEEEEDNLSAHANRIINLKRNKIDNERVEKKNCRRRVIWERDLEFEAPATHLLLRFKHPPPNYTNASTQQQPTTHSTHNIKKLFLAFSFELIEFFSQNFLFKVLSIIWKACSAGICGLKLNLKEKEIKRKIVSPAISSKHPEIFFFFFGFT